MPQTTAQQHAEWLSLLEISGPFLSMPVLLNVFPQGLDNFPPEEARSLGADYEYWKENLHDPAVHIAWIRLVLESMLGYSSEVLLTAQAIPAGYKAEFPEHEETLRPDMMLAEPGTHTPRLLVQMYPPSQALEKSLQNSRWQASIATRMMELLHATEIPLGLVTNGEQWMFVYAPRGETTGFTSWYAGLWFDERLTLRAFRSLLGVKRFFGVPDNESLENLLAKSIQDQSEVTDQLGLQVRHAVEILIQSIDRADQDKGRKLLGAELPPVLLYEAALTVMMRLVFMLSAEERRLLPLDDLVYQENYAISTLVEQLRNMADEEVLERRYDAWSRLLAVFRAVYAGIQHDRLNLPSYGGSLFDPDRYPFLEGRAANTHWQNSPAQPLPINNRTVLHLLDALQFLQMKVPGGGAAEARRLSFRALDVEQIGHVYEGLLDHIAVRTQEPVLGLAGAKRQEPEIPLAKLEQARAKSESDFLAWLHDETGRSVSALKNALTNGIQNDPQFVAHLRAACGNDEPLLQRVLPFAGLIRQDDLAFPVVILPGSVYVTEGTTRRATGTHYTPRSLTEPIVQHTLEPLVYTGPAEGLPKEQWTLKSPAELLELKICDMAMGSAGFLVQVVRYLSERLVEAWLLKGGGMESGGLQITPEGKAATGKPGEWIIPRDDEERLILARRLVADRCIYGVDKNPLAVEIAKLSIWLVTMDKGRPFTFLDHALKCGDSLVGASEEDFLRWARGMRAAAATLFDEELQRQVALARHKRRELAAFEVREIRDAERKAALLQEAEAALTHVKRGCDLLTGVRLLGLKPKEIEDLQLNLLHPYMAGELEGEIEPRRQPSAARALHAAYKEHAFHWEFEFPEVFEKGGFSAFVGNPPFLGGTRISTTFGNEYLAFLQKEFPTFQSRADLCALFYIRAYILLAKTGIFSLIATNTISQGDTRETGLDYITGQLNGSIYWAIASMDWPGTAGVTVSIIGIFKNGYIKMKKILNGSSAKKISPFLEDTMTDQMPYRLILREFSAYTGSKLDGIGFVLDKTEAISLLKDGKNTDVIFPYLNGDDTNSQPDQKATRYVINFFDWSEEEARQYKECFNLVRERVYPQRLNHSEARVRQNYWLYQRSRPEMYEAIKPLNRILVLSAVSKWFGLVFVDKEQVINVNLCVFTTDRWDYYSILQSNIHEIWARQYSSTLETRLSYSISDAFETFPMMLFFHPNSLESIGEKYHEHRYQIMLSRQDGLTTTYNRFNNPKEYSVDITRFRELHVEMDNAVAAAYSWSDIDLGHGFRETAQGVRFTISEEARREVLARLLQLNHERYEEEVKQGLHEKKSGTKVKLSATESNNRSPKHLIREQPSLLYHPETVQKTEIAPTLPEEKATPTEQIGSWDQCICLGCSKHLVGFSVAEHTKAVHQGKDPGYRKLKT